MNSGRALKKKNYGMTQLIEQSHFEYIIANHINKFISLFCNSRSKKIQELNYLDIIQDKNAYAFVKRFYNKIETLTRIFLGKMDKAEIDITHDFYLKKFQLSKPKLPFDYILFDEDQDASPAMLDVFINQNTTKVIVGDTHQQIYGWRHAVNSLEKTQFKDFSLSTSFRFNQEIADLAVNILEWKSYINQNKNFSIIGKGISKKSKTKATITRTNLGLLLKAIEYVTEKELSGKIYFEGNISSYTYAEDGASLYDILNLYNGNRILVRDKLIKKMRNLEELSEYIEKTEDVQLSMMVEIVKEYGNRIPGIIQEIKDKHLNNDQKQEAEMIFSTVHRSKGMEYDSIQIVNDFISEETLEKLNEDKKTEIYDSKVNEEINLLYVAVTRAKYIIYIPEDLIPKDFNPISTVRLIRNIDEQVLSEETTKAYSIDKIREKHNDAYKPWTEELDDELTVMFCEGVNIKDMAKHFGRTRGAIKSRIKKLELEELYR